VTGLSEDVAWLSLSQVIEKARCIALTRRGRSSRHVIQQMVENHMVEVVQWSGWCRHPSWIVLMWQNWC
jgi:hypothetical protein